MTENRVCYAAGLLGAVAFYVFFQEALSLLVLAVVLALPLISAAAGFIGRRDVALSLSVPAVLARGEDARLQVRLTARRSVAGVRCRVLQENLLTGERALTAPVVLYRGQEVMACAVLASHCGAVRCTVVRPRMLDLLGLFALPVEAPSAGTVCLMPRPARPEPCPAPPQPAALRPRPGGGPGEDHDLRPFRPGDPMKSIHWKLSRKTGTMMVREPLEPAGQTALLTVELWGAPERLDAVLDQTAYLLQLLLDWGAPFSAAAVGAAPARIAGEAAAERWLRTLLSARAPAAPAEDAGAPARADWLYRVTV